MKCVLCSLSDREKGPAYLSLDFLLSYAKKNKKIRNEIEFVRILPDKKDNLDSVYKRIYNEKPDIIGFSCYLWNSTGTLLLSMLIKESIANIKIVIGGPEVDFLAEEILEKNKFIDIIVRGEGEITFSEILLYYLEKSPQIDDIKGISFRKNNKVVSTKDRDLIKNLDEIPSPLFYLPDKCDEIALQFSRGCVYKCNYCTWPGLQQIRSFSIERIVDDFKIAFSKNPKRITIYDSAFNIPFNRLKAVSNSIKTLNNKIPITIQCEAGFVNEEQIECFKKLNIRFLEIGLQTANKDTLKIVGKNVDLNGFKRKIKLLNKAEDISYSIDLIWGIPGDDFEKFKSSIDFSYNILGPNSIILFHLLRILPGSYFWRNYEKYKLIFEKDPPHRTISNYSYNKNDMKKSKEYVIEIISKNPWFKLFTEVDIDIDNILLTWNE